MDEAIGDLVLAPFRDIVVQGRIASGNAEEVGHDGMLTAARNLVKEGERALKRLEPLCRKNYEELGAEFVNALKNDEEISRFIEHLSDLLYDFEEVVEADNFDADKFLELQACSRKAAPGISHRITRLKLLPKAEDELGTTSSPVSPLRPTVLVRQPSDDVSLQRGKCLPYPEDTEEGGQMRYAMPWPPGQELEAQHAESPVPQALSTVQEDEPPPPPAPLRDAWSQRSQDIEQGLELIAQRREHTTYSDSAIGSEANSEQACSPNMTGQPKSPKPAVPPKSPHRIVTPSMLGPSFEQTASFVRSYYGRESVSPISPRRNRDSGASSASTSIRSFVSDPRSRERDSYFDAVSPTSPALRASGYALDAQFQGLNQGQSRSPTRSPHVRPLFVQADVSLATAQVAEGMEPVVLPAPGMIPDGLMPVEEDTAQPVWSFVDPGMQLGGCAISLNSSYYQFKGFCAGAVEIIQGGLGIKHIKKQGLAVGNIEVAKCKACAYELEWKAVERDLNNEGENFISENISFRLRFLSKSHISSKDIGEQIYGCLLCIQQRQTTHPNDATVFFGQRQLFAHLARHPRPLPHVPGLTVIQGEEVPSEFANNYDLHFSQPPRASDLVHIMRDLSEWPTATTLQTCRPAQTSTISRPADGGDVLSFAAGARVLGVQFPERYQGEWCVGWADHKHGLIPAEAIRLDPPRRNDIRNQGSSSMQAVARWRFAVKDSKEARAGDWLPFNKGEVLTNIGWSHQGHWCWSGTNSKGRSGLFPRSHMEPGTLTERATKPDRASVASNERRTTGLLSRISIRHRSGSGGGGGGGGAGSSSPRASIH